MREIKPHPGQVLKDQYLTPLSISLRDLEWSTPLTGHTLIELVDGRQSVTPFIANALAHALSTSAEFWLDLQREYDLSNPDEEEDEPLLRLVPPPEDDSHPEDDPTVITMPVITKLDLPPERVLRAALKKGLSRVVVIGATDEEDPKYYFASSASDPADVLWDLEKFKLTLLDP